MLLVFLFGWHCLQFSAFVCCVFFLFLAIARTSRIMSVCHVYFFFHPSAVTPGVLWRIFLVLQEPLVPVPYTLGRHSSIEPVSLEDVPLLVFWESVAPYEFYQISPLLFLLFSWTHSNTRLLRLLSTTNMLLSSACQCPITLHVVKLATPLA